MSKQVMIFDYLSADGYSLGIDLPDDCVADCTGRGDVSQSVEYWVDQFDWSGVDTSKVRRYLASFGAWDTEELQDDDLNIQRFLWSICCDLREQANTVD